MNRRHLTLFFLCLIFLSACYDNGSEEKKTKMTVSIFINGGVNGQNQQSPYSQLAQYLYESLEKKSAKLNIDFEPVVTNGSYQTVLGMERIDGEFQSAIGIAQADVLYHYFNGNHPQFPVPESDSKIRAIGSVFEEWLFITSPDASHRKSLSAQPISQLQLGAIGSGTMVSALNAQRLLSLRTNKDAENGASVKFRIVAPYDSIISSTNHYDKLISLSQAEAETIASSFPGCYEIVDSVKFKARFSQLPKSFNHTTVSVDAVLIGLNNLPDNVVDEIESSLEDYSRSNAKFNQENLPITRHKKLIYDKIDQQSAFNSTIAKYFTRQVLALFLGILLLLFAVNYLKSPIAQIIKYQLSLRASLKILYHYSLRLLWMLLLLAGLHFFIACLIWVSEYHYSIDHYIKSDALIANGVLGGITKIGESLITGESLNVFSVEAKVLIAILNLAYAVVSSFFVYQYSNSILKRLRKNIIMDKHTVIIGWNEVTPKVIDELISFGQKKYQIIGTQEASAISKDRFRNHYHQKKTSISDLESVRLDKAKTVIIMSDKDWAKQENIKDVDLLSLRILRDIVDFKEGKKSNFRIVAEVEDVANEALLLEAGADEVICINSFGYELLPHAGSRPKLSLIFKELLKTEKENNEVYYMDLKIENNQNPQFSDVTSFLNNANKGLQAIAIGVLKSEGDSSKPILNPDPKQKLNEGDKIVVITKGNPKIPIVV